MVIEVLGSRVIGPFFGVSLFIWTSLIAVTMIALALGYAFGGVLSDRRGTPEALYAIIFIAGLLVLGIPFAKASILKLCVPMGLRLGTFVSSSLLFGPPLFLLGCVSPYLIKIAAKEMDNLGRTVGGFYALSTIGSVAGTSLTGFVLIAYLGVDQIFQLVGVLLIGISVGYFVIFRRFYAALTVLVLVFFVVPSKSETSLVKIMEDGTQASLVASHDSHYGSLKVVDYKFEQAHIRELIIDGLVQGGIDMVSGLSFYEYSYFLEQLPYALNPQGKNCLVIGLGAGVIPRWYEAQGIKTDVVDIDESVVDFAREHFNFKLQGDVYIQDARYFLRTQQKTYDYVVLDVFTGDTTPAHLLSLEALQLVADKLTHNGVLGINLAGSVGREPYMTASVVKTLKQVFDQVEVYPTFDPEKGDGSGNLVIVAYTGQQRTLDLRKAQTAKVHPMVQEIYFSRLNQQFRFPESTEAIILTDNYNPVDFYDAWLRESVRQKIIQGTDWDILMHSS